MGDRVSTAIRGTVTVRRWDARCKDCQRRGSEEDGFRYPDSWATHVVERGGSRSDRCPECRKLHNRDIASMAIPYIDLDVIGRVADPANPTGPLGGLGPLLTEHHLTELVADLAEHDLGLTDDHIRSLLTELEHKQVAVVVAGTGSGKSTFLPYRLLVPPEGARLHLADHGTIVVTEPRVFATKDVAGFVAGGLHRSLPVGAGCEIGYRVKDDPAFDAGCRLLFVTDGSLINWLGDGSLDRFSTIVIDEAHERSRNIDLILGVLRTELSRRPHLRVIIASATIDADFFVEYFGGPERVAKLPVDADKRFGYGVPIWPGEEIDVQHEDWDGRKGEDLRQRTREYAQLRVIKSAEDVPRADAWREKMPQLLVDQVAAILKGTRSGDVLGFLPSKVMIDNAVTALEAELGPDVDVYPLYRGVAEKIQEAAREARPPGARRRVVIATNIAETSLTLHGMTFVVDSGLIVQSSWDVASASKTLRAVPHSQDGVRQRWGRVGRKAPGWVFPLYSRQQHESLPAHTPPESVREDLEGFVLHAAAIGIHNVSGYVWPASFKRAAEDEATRQSRISFETEVNRAERALRERGLLDPCGDVTIAGSELLAFNGQLAHANALVGADELACGVEMATALTMLGGPGFWQRIMLFKRNAPAPARNALRRVHAGLRAGCLDDLDLALKVYAGWERAEDKAAWAAAHAVGHQELLKITSGPRRDAINFLSPGRLGGVKQRVRPELAPRVRAVLSRAFADVTFVERDGQWAMRNGQEQQREYVLSSPGYAPASEALIALDRHPYSAQRAYLSGLVEVYPWAQETCSWLSLAIELARRFRDEDGSLRAPDFSAHFALAGRFPIGSRHRCLVVTDGGNTRALKPSQVEAAPADPALGAVSEDDDIEETDVEIELAAPEAAAGNAAMLAAAANEPATDLVSMLKRDDVVTDPDSEDQYQDIAEAETPEPEPPAVAAEEAQAAAGDATLDEIDISPQIRALTGEALPRGELVFRVVGYDGVGADRTLLILADSDPTPFDRAVTAGYKRDTPIKVRVTEHVAGWGQPFLLTEETETGLEVALGPTELTLSADDQAVVDEIMQGAELDVTLLAMDPDRRIAQATRFPQLLRHLDHASARLDAHVKWYPARTTGQAWLGRPVAVLEHADASRGILHRFVVDKRGADELRLSMEPDIPLLVTLRTKKKGRVQPRTTKTLPRISEEFAAKLAELCKLSPGKMLFDATDPPKLIAIGQLSAGHRDRLARLSDNRGWHDMMASLWRQSNTLGIDRVKLGEGNAALVVARAREEHEVGQTVEAIVDNLASYGLFVKFGSNRSGLIHRSMIGPRGLTVELSELFERGMAVTPRLEEIEEHEGRGAKFTLTLREYKPPAGAGTVDVGEIAARHPVGSIADGVVSRCESYGVFVQVDADAAMPAVLVHKSKIGIGLIRDPSVAFTVGMPASVTIETIKKDNGQLKVSGAIPQFSLATIARADTPITLSLSYGWKSYLAAVAQELERLAARTSCTIELVQRDLMATGSDVNMLRDALRELDEIFARPLALVQIPNGGMGRLIGKERRGLNELEQRFGVYAVTRASQVIMGGKRREDVEAAIATIKGRPQLNTVTFTWLPPDGRLPQKE